MPGISVSRIPIGFNKGSGGGLSPSVLAKALYYGRIADISGGEMTNLVTGATDYITVGGSAGSYTFQVPQTAAYANADTDYIWHSTSLAWRTVTQAEMVGYDFPRTPVKFDDDSPNSIREVLILKAGETLTAEELINVHHTFRLPILWSGVWVDEGYEKSNRGIAQQYIWTLPPENVVCSLDGSDIQIDWDDVANNEDGYSIERSTDNVNFAEIDTVADGVETFTDDTVGLSTQYYYRLRAFKDGIYSSYSNTDNETTGAGYEAESIALFNRMTALSETPDDTRKTVIDDAIAADKAAIGFTTKYDAMWLLAAHGNDSSLLNIVKNATNCEVVDTPTFTTDRGYKGNGSSDALKTNYNLLNSSSLFTVNSGAFGLYVRENKQETTYMISASNADGKGISFIPRYTTNQTNSSLNGTSGSNSTPTDDSSGMWIITRDSNNLQYKIYRNGTLKYTIINTSDILINVIIYLLCYNSSGSLSYWSTNEVALAFVGDEMSAQQVADFQTIWVDGYLNSIGAKV
jgi:hypothetical protein